VIALADTGQRLVAARVLAAADRLTSMLTDPREQLRLRRLARRPPGAAARAAARSAACAG
jgi:hypothetical protein